MKLAELEPTGSAAVVCVDCGYGPFFVVDRYLTDWPPIPRGRHPESFVEFYIDDVGDPDDRFSECPQCDRLLELDAVREP